MITYGQLSRLHTGLVGAAGEDYGSAGTRLRSAGTRYAAEVVRPVDGGQVWSGNGRGHAETVVRVERLAFSTAAARMRTVATTLETLASQLAAAKKTAARVAAAAKANHYLVDDETGKITRDPQRQPSISGPSDGGAGNPAYHHDAEAGRLDERMRAALRRARRADKACSQLLDTVIGADFVSTATAQPGVLGRAKHAEVEAEGGELYAMLLGGILDHAYRQDLTHAENIEYGYGETLIGVGKGFWDSLRNDVSSIWNLALLLGLAASGDKTAQHTLQQMPADIRRQLTTKEGWKELANIDALEDGRPGEFAGNLLYLYALRHAKLPKITRSRHDIVPGGGGIDYSGNLKRVPKPDADADALAERINGQPRVKFENDSEGREFDAVSDEYVGQSKPGGYEFNKAGRIQAKASFEAARQTGRSVYYHFNGTPDPSVIAKLNEYSQRYDVDVIIDNDPY